MALKLSHNYKQIIVMSLVNINTEIVRKSPKGLKSLADNRRKVEAVRGSKDQSQRNTKPVEGFWEQISKRHTILVQVLSQRYSVISYQVAVTLTLCYIMF